MTVETTVSSHLPPPPGPFGGTSETGGPHAPGPRERAHPHVNEQPVTRSLSGVKAPDTAESVTVRARDSRHGFGGAEQTVTLPRQGRGPVLRGPL